MIIWWTMPLRTFSPVEERFWSKVDKTGDCWIWRGAKSESGYGRIRIDGWVYFVHRRSWMLANGEIPKDMCVLHRCDTPLCVRPDHLFLGTPQENVADMVRKNRQAQKERAGRSRLTGAEVDEIRRKWGTSKYTKIEIGKQYGLGWNAINKIIKRETWR
jgi:hypothetical protein